MISIKECFAEILDGFVDGSITEVEDLGTVLESWGFIDEDGELTNKGQRFFTEEADDED